MQPTADRLDRELSGLDALELAGDPGPSVARRTWRATWPKVGAVGLVLLIWQAAVWAEWKPKSVLPPPADAFAELRELWAAGDIQHAVSVTMSRAAVGFALALVIGIVVGSLVARVPVLRAAFGSLITGLQTMPSIAWFPLAILLYGFSESAIRFVVVLGAAPAIANGLIAGIDNTPPILIRAGKVLGARGLAAYRHVLLPAALPSFVGGLKQGWAFAWRSLMAGELLAVVKTGALGELLDDQRNLSNADGLLAIMLVILAVGIVVDAAVFGVAERAVRRRWGLLETAR
jgi:NitT/TauT family transport system permease protein